VPDGSAGLAATQVVTRSDGAEKRRAYRSLLGKRGPAAFETDARPLGREGPAHRPAGGCPPVIFQLARWFPSSPPLHP
jgi:hypothetical protein